MRTACALLILAFGTALTGCGPEGACEADVRIASAGSTEVVLRACAAVARTEAERIQGLSGSAPLAPDEALILEAPVADNFCITNEPVTFAIDAVYVAEDGTVTAVEREIPAGENGYRCHDDVRRVIELLGGVAAPVEPGDFTQID